jgi:hypothetical protein
MAQSYDPSGRSDHPGTRRMVTVLAVAVGLLLLLSSCELPPADTTTRPLLGVLGATGAHYAEEKNAGIGVVTIAASWASSQPTSGAFSTTYAAQLNGRIDAAKAAGFEVILDPGIQYTPAWVFDLPGGTRFVNQYGDVFSGAAASGDNVANAVTNAAVRSALGR